MPKTFYTDHDIEDMHRSGKRTLNVSEDIVLTDLAYEKAKKLGLELLTDRPANPPAAPVRPYLAQGTRLGTDMAGVSAQNQAVSDSLRQRIRNAVIEKMGNHIDPELLDTIITRVLMSTGLK